MGSPSHKLLAQGLRQNERREIVKLIDR